RDTLAKIASWQLGNAELAGLLFDINAHIIPHAYRRGKTYLDLRPGLIIWLPTRKEIEEFQGQPWSIFTPEFAYLDETIISNTELGSIFGAGVDDSIWNSICERMESIEKMADSLDLPDRVDSIEKEGEPPNVNTGDTPKEAEPADPDLTPLTIPAVDTDLGKNKPWKRKGPKPQS